MLLGPAGVGILAWIRNICDLLTTFPLMGLDAAATRDIARHARAGDRVAIQRVLATTLMVVLFNAPLAVALYLWVAPWHIAHPRWGMQDGASHLPLLVVGLLSAPLAAVASAFGAFLIGFKAVRRTSALVVASSLLTLFVGVPLILAFCLWGAMRAGARLDSPAAIWAILRHGTPQTFEWGLRGAVVGLLVLQAINLGMYIAMFRGVFRATLRGFSPRVMADMSRVAFANWVGVAVALLAFLMVRSRLSTAYSNEAMGLFQTIYALCASYLGPLSHTLIYYSYPRMSELRERAEIAEEIGGSMRVVMLLSTPAMALMATAIEPLLVILYSDRFVAAAPLLPFMMLGEWFRLPMRCMGVALLAHQRIRPYMTFDIGFYALMAAVTYWSGDLFDIAHDGHVITRSPSIGYAAGAIVATIGYYFVSRREFGFRIGADNARLAVASLVMLGVSLFVTAEGPLAWVAAAGKIALLGVWAAVVVRRDEWRRLRELLAGLARRAGPA